MPAFCRHPNAQHYFHALWQHTLANLEAQTLAAQAWAAQAMAVQRLTAMATQRLVGTSAQRSLGSRSSQSVLLFMSLLTGHLPAFAQLRQMLQTACSGRLNAISTLSVAVLWCKSLAAYANLKVCASQQNVSSQIAVYNGSKSRSLQTIAWQGCAPLQMMRLCCLQHHALECYWTDVLP